MLTIDADIFVNEISILVGQVFENVATKYDVMNDARVMQMTSYYVIVQMSFWMIIECPWSS